MRQDPLFGRRRAGLLLVSFGVYVYKREQVSQAILSRLLFVAQAVVRRAWFTAYPNLLDAFMVRTDHEVGKSEVASIRG